MGKKRAPAFLRKLYEILNDKSIEDIVSWNHDGESFIIKNYRLFCQQILPSKFKTNVFSSFVRQLNIYDFHKMNPKISSIKEFENPNFKRNKPNNLILIKRKSKPEKHRKSTPPELSLITMSSTEESSGNPVDPMEIEEIKTTVINIAENLIKLKERVGSMQKKYDLLEHYKQELGQKSVRIKDELYCMTEKEHNLQQLFFCIVSKFFPSFMPNEYKLLPDEQRHKKDNELINEVIIKMRDYFLSTNPDKETKVFCQKAADLLDTKSTPSTFTNIRDLYSHYFNDVECLSSQEQLNKSSEFNPKKELLYCSRIRKMLTQYLSELDSNITITETEQSKLEEQIDINVKHQITIDCTDKENNNCKAHGKTVFAVTSEID